MRVGARKADRLLDITPEGFNSGNRPLSQSPVADRITSVALSSSSPSSIRTDWPAAVIEILPTLPVIRTAPAVGYERMQALPSSVNVDVSTAPRATAIWRARLPPGLQTGSVWSA